MFFEKRGDDVKIIKKMIKTVMGNVGKLGGLNDYIKKDDDLEGS